MTASWNHSGKWTDRGQAEIGGHESVQGGSGARSSADARRNRVLAALPTSDYTWLRATLETVAVCARQVLYEPDEVITHVYFPLTAVVSILIPGEDGTSVETALVGDDGVVGLPLVLGLDRDTNRAITQIAGTALRLPAPAFRAALGRGDALRGVLQRYTQVILVQMGQSAACNRLHPMYGRCARWLLEIQDRVRSDAFPLTPHFLADMLTARRATVTVTAGKLRDAGLIRYRRGQVTILDRERLEVAACDCYRVIAAASGRLLRGAGGSAE